MTLLCCGQPVGLTGYCDTCGRQRVRAPAPRPTPSNSTESRRIDPSVYIGSFAADELYSLPPIELDDPEAHLRSDPVYPEERQFCANPLCRRPVGQRIGRQASIQAGVCPFCETPFSFEAKLKPGEVVAKRYEVRGCLAVGGLGWIYLARDRELRNMHVVLKGMINPTHAQRLRLATVERDALTRLNHQNIVRIIGYAEHPGPGDHSRPDHYIVMEYVGGKTLHDILRSGARVRLEDVTAYGHGILSALDYMHNEGLLYCDMKPENVMHAGKRIRVIDLGATRAVDDQTSVKIGTEKFGVGRDELERWGLTVRSDVYTVGTTLEELLDVAKAHETDYEQMALGIRSLERLLGRATAPYEARFTSGREMLEQLDGVHRELLSLRDGQSRAVPSAHFEDMAELLDAGLGAVPGLGRWTGDEPPDGSISDGLPHPALAATRLPLPRTDETDPAADLITETRILAEPRKRLREYEERGQNMPNISNSVELNLASARAYLEFGEIDAAGHRIALARQHLGERVPHDWRIPWHAGLLCLAKSEVDDARMSFDACYGLLPGEEVPKLILGFCLERLGNDDGAYRYYQAVRQRDGQQASAVFGLARIALRRGERGDAVAILDALPRVSPHYYAAKIAAVRILLARLGGAPPATGDIDKAAERLPELFLDGGEKDGKDRQRMVALLREAALARVLATVPAMRSLWGSGDPVGEDGLRLLLESSYRELARHARTQLEHGVLIDRANSIRPWSTW